MNRENCLTHMGGLVGGAVKHLCCFQFCGTSHSAVPDFFVWDSFAAQDIPAHLFYRLWLPAVLKN